MNSPETGVRPLFAEVDMKSVCLILALSLLCCVPAVYSGQQPPDPAERRIARAEQEKRCTQAIEGMLREMKSTPLTTPDDIKRVNELIARIEGMIAANRRRGVDECRTWDEFGRILFHE